MPQADIGIINSTVFFLFTSFILGYFVWVNFLFPRVLTSIRVKNFVSNIKEKNYLEGAAIVDKFSEKRLAIKFGFSFFSYPTLALTLNLDEVVLLFNTFLVSLFFYLISVNMLKKIHINSQNYILSLCKFDFSEDINEAVRTGMVIVKYLRLALVLGVFKLIKKWSLKRDKFLFKSLSLLTSSVTDEVLSGVADKVGVKRVKRGKSFFKRVKRKNKIRLTRLLSIPTKPLTLKKKFK